MARQSQRQMREVIEIVREKLEKEALVPLLGRLRSLDNEMDLKMEDIRVAQQGISVLDRINIFTNTESEQRLKEENRIYKEIRDEHGAVISEIKGLIRIAIYQDFRVALQIQAGEIMKATLALKVEQKWGTNVSSHQYQIKGAKELRGEVLQIANMISQEFNLPAEPLDAEFLLNLVYDDVLRRAGFIE